MKNMKSMGLLSNWRPFTYHLTQPENVSCEMKSVSAPKQPEEVNGARQPTDMKVQPQTSGQSQAGDHS